MTKRMKIWFPEFFTEAHRKPGEGDVLAEELRKFGIDSKLELTHDCSFIFCGSTWRMNLVKEERLRFPEIPTIHYNWDLYPFQLMELLEGYWHGKPSLISNSFRHGGIDYFGDRASYFQWDNHLLFRKALLKMADSPPKIDIDAARTWIAKEYSEYAMAERMAKRFWELYNESN